MNEHTEKNINEAIDWLQQTGGSIQDFAMEQAPIYCKELIRYELWTGAIWLTLALLMLIVGVVLTWRGLKDDEEGTICSGFALGIISLLVLVLCSGDFVKAIVAPRVVIVEHLKSLK